MYRYLVSCLLIAAIILASGFLFSLYWEHRYDDLITRQARVYRLDEKLVWSLIYQKLTFKPGRLGRPKKSV